jgi:enterobacterial common antigen flippase
LLKILKAFLKTGLGSFGTVFFGIISTKIFAVYLGTDGVGFLSTLRQIRNTGFSLAGMSGEAALVQGIASNNKQKKEIFIKTIFILYIFSTVIFGIIYLLFAPTISKYLFNSSSVESIVLVKWMIIPIALFVFVSFFKSILNGYKMIGPLAITTVIGSATTALLAYPASSYIKSGNNIAFIFMMTLTSFFTMLMILFFLYKESCLSWLLSEWKLKKWAVKRFYLISFSMMITGFAHSGTLLLIKGWITQKWDISSVGIFDVSWTISMIYIGLITKSFSTYYLPSLSEIIDTETRIVFIRKVFRLVILLLVPAVVFIVVTKNMIVNLLYSSEFIVATPIIRWMLIGDYFKVSSWVLTFPMIAYSNMKIFIISGLLWWVTFGLLSYISIIYFNSLEGVGLVYLLLYAIYFCFSLIYIYKYHNFSFTIKILIQWVMGLIIVIGASIISWSNTIISANELMLLILIIIFYMWFSIRKDEKNMILLYLNRRIK